MADDEKKIVIELLDLMAKDLISMASCVQLVKATLEDQEKFDEESGRCRPN